MLSFRQTASLTFAISSVATASLVSQARADTFTAIYGTPALDRWNYPFNPTPGTRIVASTFGNDPTSTMFDNRDGQFIVGFNTGAQIPAGLGASTYTIQSCVVEITYANDQIVQYDATVDPYNGFLAPTDPDYIEDADPGQPLEMYGVGFRNGFSLATWTEYTPYSPLSPLDQSVRSAYALGTNASGQWVDVSNSVRQRWTPSPFAVGTIKGLKPGAFVPINSRVRFALDVSRADVQQYLRTAVDAGRMRLTVSSLTKVVQQGGNFPTFYCRENPIVTATGVGAATLAITVSTSTCAPADLNCDGSVNAQDLATLLSQWGGPGSADLNHDGIVGPQDLAVLLGAWG